METLCAPDYAQVITDALGPGALDRAERESVFQFADEGAAILEWCFDAATASRITQPVLLVQCVPMYGPIMADLVAWLPQATLTELEGTDHMLPLRDPATLAALIAAFVRQHRTQRLVDQV
jgi:pimeloyl-ACP methyl ester carboxylesterase